MIRRAIFFMVQKYLWSKLLNGSFKSKIMSLLSIGFFTIFGGTAFAMLTLNMSFIQGAWWTWGHIEGSLGSMIRMFF